MANDQSSESLTERLALLSGGDGRTNSETVYVDPDFIEELDTLGIAIDEYERMLADSESAVITTSNATS
jgi:hypothetical protein